MDTHAACGCVTDLLLLGGSKGSKTDRKHMLAAGTAFPNGRSLPDAPRYVCNPVLQPHSIPLSLPALIGLSGTGTNPRHIRSDWRRIMIGSPARPYCSATRIATIIFPVFKGQRGESPSDALSLCSKQTLKSSRVLKARSLIIL